MAPAGEVALGAPKRTIVFIPTYNERETIGPLVDSILALDLPGLGVLVVDDCSPDRTGSIVAGIAAEDSRVELIERPGPRGRGLASKNGFSGALARGADLVVEMDGDGSHRPDDIPTLLAASSNGDVVIGSRLVPGGLDPDRGSGRRVITKLSNAYLKVLFDFPVEDVTSGFRCYNRRALELIRPEALRSRDPFVMTEVLFRAYRAGCSIIEVPIRFEQRKGGCSKLGAEILARYLYKALLLRWSEHGELPLSSDG